MALLREENTPEAACSWGANAHMLAGLAETPSGGVISHIFAESMRKGSFLCQTWGACKHAVFQPRLALRGLGVGWGSVYFYSDAFLTVISSGKHPIQFSQWSKNRLMGPQGVWSSLHSANTSAGVERAQTIGDLVTRLTWCPRAGPSQLLYKGTWRTHTRLGLEASMPEREGTGAGSS